LDVTLQARTTYRHPTKTGHNVFIYVIGGKGYFCRERKPFTYEFEGINYFDMGRDPFVGDGEIVLFEDGEEVFVSAEGEPIRFLLISGKRVTHCF
jgi:redox-sensitive bicupin YhaK (pirin superfamily)